MPLCLTGILGVWGGVFCCCCLCCCFLNSVLPLMLLFTQFYNFREKNMQDHPTQFPHFILKTWSLIREKVWGIVLYPYISIRRHKTHWYLKQALEFRGQQQGLKCIVNLFQPKHRSKNHLKIQENKICSNFVNSSSHCNRHTSNKNLSFPPLGCGEPMTSWNNFWKHSEKFIHSLIQSTNFHKIPTWVGFPPND